MTQSRHTRIFAGCMAAIGLAASLAGQPGATSGTVTVSPGEAGTTIPESISPAPTPGKWQNFWINRVREFVSENATLDPAKRNIVFVGDSLTQGFKLKTFFPDLPVLNRGIVSDGVADFPSGRNVWRGVTRRLNESIFDCRPSHLFLLIGTNDVGVKEIPLDYWFGAYQYVVRQTRDRFPDVKIVLVTCPPSGEAYARHDTLNRRIREWNTRIRDYASSEGCRLIDLHALLADKEGMLSPDLTRDGLHFNETGYGRWADSVRKILREDGVIRDEAGRP